jgi:hypothetical protein
MAKTDNTLLIAGAVAAVGYFYGGQIAAWFGTATAATTTAPYVPPVGNDTPVSVSYAPAPDNTTYAAQQATAAALAVGGTATPAQQAVTAGQTAAAVVAQQGGTPVQQQAAASLAAAQTAATAVTQQGGTPATAATAAQLAANAAVTPPPPVVQYIPPAIAALQQPVAPSTPVTVPAGGIPFTYLIAAAASAAGQDPAKQVAAYQAELQMSLQGLPRRRATRRFYDQMNRAA